MVRMVSLLALAGCGRPLGSWCEDHASDPVCLDNLPTLIEGCGATDRSSASGGGYDTTEYYFSHRSGELVAVRWWTDTDSDDGTWYGRVVSCDDPCSYTEDGGSRPCTDAPPF